MSDNIVKSFAVVDDRGDKLNTFTVFPKTNAPVLKRGLIKGGTMVPPKGQMKTKDAYLDDLNRVRVDISDAHAELRKMSGQLEQARVELGMIQEERRKLESLQNIDVDAHAQLLVHNAEEEAQRMLREAERQAAEIREEAHRAGHAEGLEHGIAEAFDSFKIEHQHEIGKISSLLSALDEMKTELFYRYEEDLVKLSVSVAEKIIGRTVKEDPKAIVDMLREVVEQNHREEYIKIKISDDLMPAEAKVSENISAMIQNLCQQISVVVDVTLEDDDIVVETPRGYTDLGVSVQLENIEQELIDQMKEERNL